MKSVITFSEIPPHHAVLMVHKERGAVGASLFDELKELSPVHRFFDQSVLDIETARYISSWSNTPYSGEKVGLISFNTAGLEAQNALLKVLEEPRAGVRFIIITTHREHLIPTVLSRLHQMNLTQDVLHDEMYTKAYTFLTTPKVNRMNLKEVKLLLEEEDEEGRKKRESVKSFILALTDVLKTENSESRYILETLEFASYASRPSTSGKALIEYLALLLLEIRN